MGYKTGQKVIYIPENKVYDFGYFSQKLGYVVIYEEGERNMQDSYAVPMNDIKPIWETRERSF